jgi:hypothetical protein
MNTKTAVALTTHTSPASLPRTGRSTTSALPFTLDHLLAHLQIESDFVVDRAVVTRGRRIVIRDLLRQAHDAIERLTDECESLRCENAQLRGDLDAAYCRMDDMEGLNHE